MPATRSILPPEMRGVAKISGYRGIGKTSLAVQADAPPNVIFLDFENKGEGFHNQLGFGLYRALTQEASGPLELYDLTMSAIDQIEQDRFTVAIFDNISPLELALQAGARKDVKRYVEEYGLNLKNVLAGRYGGLRSVVNFLISDQVCSPLHSKGIQLVIATSHIKPRWGTGGPIANKYRIKGADRWQELSILSLILVPGEHAPVPAALVQKEQLGQMTYDETTGEFSIRRRLPFRLPQCTFKAIKEYLANPADLDNPAPGESLIEEENEPFAERLSREQMTLMTLALQKEQREQSEDSEIEKLLQQAPRPTVDPTVKTKVLEMRKEDHTLSDIAKETGLTIPQLLEIED